MKKQILFRVLGLFCVVAIVASFVAVSQPASVQAKSLSGYVRQYIQKYGVGGSNCSALPSTWSDAVCYHNAIMRFATDSSFAPSFKSSLDKCYWRYNYPSGGWTGGCDYSGSHNIEARYAEVYNSSTGFYHAIVAWYKGTSGYQYWSNWNFYQYDDTDIRPGEWQMPCGSGTTRTQVNIKSMQSISCSSTSVTNVRTFYIDKNCNVTASATNSASSLPAGSRQVEWINAEIAKLQKEPKLEIAAWVVEMDEKQVNIWVTKLTPENQKLNGTLLDGWKVNVWEDQLTKRLAEQK